MLSQNIDFGYTLLPPRRGGSNEYSQSMFLSKNKKNSYTPTYNSFYAPNFEENEGAYWFGSVRAVSECMQSVSL